MPNQKHYFRDKRLTRRQGFHQKYLRPLAIWIASQHPKEIIIKAIPVAGTWLALRLLIVNFYMLAVALPWIIMAIALVLAGISYALRQGDK